MFKGYYSSLSTSLNDYNNSNNKKKLRINQRSIVIPFAGVVSGVGIRKS